MPLPLAWTPRLDTEILLLRADGASWETIAVALGLSRAAVSERGRAIGAVAPPRPPRIERPEHRGPRSLPLPAGHAETWGAITAGTCLAGHPYPRPPLQAEAE